ncbi:hypothetical protein Bca4012_016089 [Brassica carinata]
MANRRLSVTEKGKGLVSEPYQAPRKARVRVQEPDNSYLIQKHSLTIVGRVTNPSAQKVWSLIPFFTDRWSVGSRPRGSDLGQGMFQFQFDSEADLLEVLDKRPYTYAKWSIIVQRWEPTTAPDFPSLIPFWIKVQGLPLHLWTEETIRSIGQDIGIYETAEITTMSARMRVQVNGRLPLITSSVVEYPNGDEVTATLVYEKIGKYCTCCFRLDHELRDCLKAKAEKREAQSAAPEYLRERSQTASSPGRNHSRYHNNASNARMAPQSSDEHRSWPPLEREQNRRTTVSHKQDSRRSRDSYGKISENRDSHRRRYQPYAQSRHDSRNPRETTGNSSWRNMSHRQAYKPVHPEHSYPPLPPPAPIHGRLSYRSPDREGSTRAESCSQKKATTVPDKGTPLRENRTGLPHSALNDAREELRDVMIQYTSCADPTESAARKERLRQAEQKGQLEESVTQIAAARLDRTSLSNHSTPVEMIHPSSSADRIPALLRIGSPPSPLIQQATGNGASPHRTSALSRLGQLSSPRASEPARDSAPTANEAPTRRKPGRPPGTKKISDSPRMLAGSNSRKRKVQQTKAPNCKRKLPVQVGPSEPGAGSSRSRKVVGQDKNKRRSAPSNSDNQPICNMIPAAAKRKKADFQNPSTLVP